MQRCYYKKSINYALYGGRGITVCDKWHTFADFLIDMGERPTGLTLDRIKTNKNYTPGNCRWATGITQGRNKRTNRVVEFEGGQISIVEMAERTGIYAGTLLYRLDHGIPLIKPGEYLSKAA